jgi:NHL repeat/Beta-propeller repeat
MISASVFLCRVQMHGMIVRRAIAKSLFLTVLLSYFVFAAKSTCAQVSLPAYGYIATIAGTGAGGYSGDSGPANGAKLYQPYHITVDSNGNIYIADTINNRIRKVTASTGTITTIAGNGAEGYSGDGGPATSAELNRANSVALDTGGNLYIADIFNACVRKVTVATGIISTVAGVCTHAGYSGDGGQATSATLNEPAAVVLDSGGNLYIADEVNARVRKVTVLTGIITTVAGNGAEGYNGDNQPATDADLYCPSGLALDIYQNLYISDSCDNRVREVSASTGMITTVVGNGIAGYSNDGDPATVAELNTPNDVAVDASGEIFVADTLNNRIRKVSANGIISTVAGNGTQGNSGDGGVATSAEFEGPAGLALDSSDNLYIDDTVNNRTRVVGGELTAITLNPLYKVLSILYSPPGNGSSQGYGQSTTNATTTTVGSSFTFAQTYSFSPGFKNVISLNESLGSSTTTTNSSAFTQSFTDATSITTSENSTPTFNPSSSNDINHNLDQFEIWLNPLITFEMNGTIPVTYTVGSNPVTINGAPSTTADIIGIPAISMEPTTAGVSLLNPSGIAGITTVPEDVLAPIRTSQNSGVDAYIPGLGAVCANNTLYQQELAADLAAEAAGTNRTDAYCTQANQCGCTPNDFMPILLSDPLLFSNSTTLAVTNVQGGTWQNTNGPAYYVLVTFSGNTPPVVTSTPNWYTFSGLTNFTALNGQTLSNALPSQPGASNPLPTPGVNQAVFIFGSSTFGPASDTGQALTPGPINPYAGTVSPLVVDALPTSSGPGSGINTCEESTVPATANCRYVPAPQSPAILLQGGVDSPSLVLTDSMTTAETIGGSTSSSDSISISLGGGLLGLLKRQDTFTWTNMESIGNSYGSANTMTATFKSSTTACNEEVSIYEDTVYHTFAFLVPSGVTSCNTPSFYITATPVSGSQPALSLGHSVTYNVNVSPLYGFTGVVNLSVSGLPTGVTASFSAASITTSGSATLTLTAAYNAATDVGQSNVTVTGTSGSLAIPTEFSLTTRPLQYAGTCNIQ